jgi:PHD/YefM family antitoxin component YafN of YafNO toxin-antitoxin module
MNIRPSADIRQNYNEISNLCKETAKPVFLTKNGTGDLVVMDIDTYNRRELLYKIREDLLSVEEDRLAGRIGLSVKDLDSYLTGIIKEVK